MNPFHALSDARLIFFGGKGGVGKTTVSLAAGLAMARSGRKILHMSVSQQGVVAGLFGRKRAIGYDEVKLDDNLYAMNLDPRGALHEYVLRQVKLEMIYKFVFENKIMRTFLDVAPGLDDLLSFGKIVDALDLLEKKKKSRHYDAVLVDLPATGHGLNMLRVPKTVITMIPAGPLNRHAHRMLEILQNDKVTALCAVTLAEEMPVNETLEMIEGFKRDLQVPARLVFVNGVYDQRFEKTEIEALVARAAGDSVVAQLVTAARSHATRYENQREQSARLVKSLGDIAHLDLPFLFVPKFDREAIGHLAEHLRNPKDAP